jgi:hypothetical protein
VPGKERFARGEQEVATTVRVLREGRAKEVLAVRCVLPGDEPPFRIDDLVSASWLKALEEVRGQARCYDPR